MSACGQILMAWRIQSRVYSYVVEMIDEVGCCPMKGQELERQEVRKGLFTPLAQICFVLSCGSL